MGEWIVSLDPLLVRFTSEAVSRDVASVSDARVPGPRPEVLIQEVGGGRADSCFSSSLPGPA